MNKYTLSAIAITLVAFLTGCGLKVQGIDLGRVASAVGNAADLTEKDIEEEIQMGKDTSQTLLDKAALADDQSIQRYVNKVGYWLAKNTSRPDLRWHFIVVDDTTINAYAAPGGYIFITTGMLGALTNEAELAGVLAHEIAHVLQRHHLVALQDGAKRGLLLDLAMLGAQSHRASQMSQGETTSNIDASGKFAKNVNKLYNKGLEREDELEADMIGIQIAAKAGYDPYAFISVLQVIESYEQKNNANLLRFTETHPSAEKRLDEIEPTLTKFDDYDLDMRVLQKRFIQNTRY